MKPRIWSRLAPLVGLLLLACGASVSSTSFMSPAPAPRLPQHPIRMYGQSVPQCPYDEVGAVTARKRSFASDEQLTEALRQRAREMGGDAVINVGTARDVSGAMVSGGVVAVAHRTSLSGTVIRFRDPSCLQ